MRRFILLFAFVSSVSFAETNTVDLTEIETLLTSIESSLDTINTQVSVNSGQNLKQFVSHIVAYTLWIRNVLMNPDTNNASGNSMQQIRDLLRVVADELSTVNTTLTDIASDIGDIAYDVDIINTRLYACQQTLNNVYSMLSGISVTLNQILAYSRSLPQIEQYQQSLALIVSNINNIVSDVGVTVNLPSTFDVRVQNMPDNINFNPAWNWQLQYMYGTGEPPAWSLAWSHSDIASDYSTTPFLLFPDLHNDATFASWAGSLYKGLENGFESVSSSGIRSTLILSSISNINTQIFRLLAGMSPDTNFLASAEETQDAVSALRADKLTTESVSHEISLIDYTPNVYSESIPNIDVRPRLSGVVGAHDTLSETANFDLGISGFFQTATDFGYTDFEHPDSSISLDMRPVNDICIAVRQLMLMVFWMLTIALGAKLCLVVYSLYQTIWVSLMSSDSDIGAGQTVNTINFMRHVLP